jgi:hypothetical protein
LVKYFSNRNEWTYTKVYVNIIPLGSYDFLIGMDWLERHHDVLDCYNKIIICLDEEGKQGKVQQIPRDIVVREFQPCI